MKTWKMVSGILSIILFVIVTFQSCAAGLVNTIEENGEVSGSAGVIVAIMLLAGGIVSICARNGGKGGNIALIILYGIGALFGFALFGNFSDLAIWAFWCLICMILAIVSLVKSGSKNKVINNSIHSNTIQSERSYGQPISQINGQPAVPSNNQSYGNGSYSSQPTKFCRNCGAPIMINEKFCGKCGTPCNPTEE